LQAISDYAIAGESPGTTQRSGRSFCDKIEKQVVKSIYSLKRSALTCCAGCVLAGAAMAAEVTVTGAGLSDDLRADVLDTALLSQLPSDAAPLDVVGAAQADYGRIVTRLYEDGHFAPEVRILLDGVEAAATDPLRPPAQIRRAVISVDPGPVFQFGSAQLAPQAGGATGDEAFETGAFETGQTARLSVMRDAADAGVQGWRALGHAKARVAGQQITADHQQRRLDVAIALEPGPLLRFGRVQIAVKSAVRPERLRAIAGLPEGATYDPDEIDRAEARLLRSGALTSARLSDADEINPGDSLDMVLETQDQKPRRLGFGGEIASGEGVSLSAFWMHRNLFGGAERLRIDAEVSGVAGDTGGLAGPQPSNPFAGADAKLSFRFERPASWGADRDLYLGGTLISRRDPALEINQASLDAGITWHASKTATYSFGAGLKTARTRDAFGTRRYTLLTLPLLAEFDRRDDPKSATTGSYAALAATPFTGRGSAGSGVQTTLDLRRYVSAGPATRRVTFALRGQLGSVAGASTAQTPGDLLFLSGGSGTVRGHAFQSLGVEQNSGTGVTTGGRSFLGLSAELRVPVRGNIGLAGFVDAGYIGPEMFPDARTGNWHQGAGLGLRYETGFGPIRLDLAVPAGQAPRLRDVQVYVGIGQSF
jgi:translocation and assembly module TamA